MNVTLDGFISGPNCELDWHFNSWTKEMADSLYQQLSLADTILLGSTTYKAMASFWPSVAKDISFPREDIAFANMMNNYKKMVFSRSLKKTEWNNSELLRGHLPDEVSKLKTREGKNIIIYGSSRIVRALTAAGLIDEFHLWLHPVLLGEGKPMFTKLPKRVQLSLYRKQGFTSGVILLYYKAGTSNSILWPMN